METRIQLMDGTDEIMELADMELLEGNNLH